MFGAKRRRMRELAHEVLRPLGKDLKDLAENGRFGNSRATFEQVIGRVVRQGRDQELYDAQKGWDRGTDREP